MPESGQPHHIFMATDLSARSDRALARAAQLAGAWNSELTVGHVVHPSEVARRDRLSSGAPAWRRPESWAQTLDRALRADLAAQAVAAKARILPGSTAEAIQQAVTEEGAGLVVLGIAKDARMDRIQLGSTTDTLVRQSPVPVLNVRSRATSNYRHVVIATDFSRPSLQALRLAARWFDRARLTLFHAYVPPGSSVTAPQVADAWRATTEAQCASFLSEADLPAAVASRLERVLERGVPEDLLPDYVAACDVDLVVLGSHGRSGVARVLLGSTSETLLHSLDCDTLVVRGTA